MIHQMILNFKSLPLVNRLNKQDFYNFIIGELAYKMEKKKLEEKSNLQSAVQNLYSRIWEVETCIQGLYFKQSMQISTN